MTDTLRIMTENTAKYAGGSMIKARFYDIINKRQNKPEDEKSGDDLVRDFVARSGLELV